MKLILGNNIKSPYTNTRTCSSVRKILLSLSIFSIVTIKFVSHCFIITRLTPFYQQSNKEQSFFVPKGDLNESNEQVTFKNIHNIINSSTPTNSMNTTNTRTNRTTKSINVIKNFRKVTGFHHLYRCASTDDLADLIDYNNYHDNNNKNDDDDDDDDETTICIDSLNQNSPEYIILNDIDLILDLRSPSERDEIKAKKWMSYCPPMQPSSSSSSSKTTTTLKENTTFTFTSFTRTNPNNNIQSVNINNNKQRKRQVYRIDVLSPSRLFDYLSTNWISSSIEKIRYNFYFAFNSIALHEMRMDILNERGLKGLYEAIIETSQEELFASLQAIVEYFESRKEKGCSNDASAGGVLVHCVQGKDRTGIVAMLCQSIIGISDEIIISDYHQSEILLRSKITNEGSAAAESLSSDKEAGSSTITSTSSSGSTSTTTQKGKLSREIFSGSPSEVMISTLNFIREKYGSINGYLDSIGFDSKWRIRFILSTSDTGIDCSVEGKDDNVLLRIQSKL